MKSLIVITCEIPDPQRIVDVMKHLDPPKIPYFAGTVRVVIDPEATEIETWLDE